MQKMASEMNRSKNLLGL